MHGPPTSRAEGRLAHAVGLGSRLRVQVRGRLDRDRRRHDLPRLGQPGVAAGDDLWSFQIGWRIGAPPMTYSVNGGQYVAVAVARILKAT